MDEDIVTELRQLYATATARDTPADARVINAWARAIASNSKTISDFVESLKGQPGYRGVVEGLYRSRLSQLLPDAVPDPKDVDDMMSGSFGRVIDKAYVDAFIQKALPMYRAQQEELVMRIASIVAPDIDACVVGTFVDRMIASGDAYTLEDVHADLEALVRNKEQGDVVALDHDSGLDFDKDSGREAATVEEIFVKNQTQQKKDDDDDDKDQISSDSPPMPTPTPTRMTRDALRELSAKLEVFEAAFGRKMYVEEFALYGVEYLQLQPDAMKKVASVFTQSYNRVREVYLDYANVSDFSPYEFVKRHLHEHDDPGFCDALADELLHSDAYKDSMCRKLSALHTEFFDDDLDPASLAYIFDRVRRASLGLHSEQLVHSIKELKKETDHILENVFFVYMAAYARPPEDDEQREHVTEYREYLTASGDSCSLTSLTDAANARLMARLIQTLEFHDVLKSKIRNEYGRRSSTSPSPGALYQVLKKVLDVLPSCNTLAVVDETVEKMVSCVLNAA